MNLEAIHEIGEAQSKCICKPIKVSKTDITLSAFDSTDVGAVEVALQREGLLGKPSLFPKSTNSLPKSDQDVAALRHALRS